MSQVLFYWPPNFSVTVYTKSTSFDRHSEAGQGVVVAALKASYVERLSENSFPFVNRQKKRSRMMNPITC